MSERAKAKVVVHFFVAYSPRGDIVSGGKEKRKLRRVELLVSFALRVAAAVTDFLRIREGFFGTQMRMLRSFSSDGEKWDYTSLAAARSDSGRSGLRMSGCFFGLLLHRPSTFPVLGFEARRRLAPRRTAHRRIRFFAVLRYDDVTDGKLTSREWIASR